MHDPILNLQPALRLEPEAVPPAAAVPATMPPKATTDPAPAMTAAAAPAPMSASVIMAMVRDQLDFGRIFAVEDRIVRLVEFVENSIAGGNSGNGLARSGQACKCGCPRNAQHSSQK